MVQALVGFAPTALHDPPEEGSLVLPASRLRAPASVAELCDSGTHARASHAYGKGFPDILRGLRGDYPRPPDLVARPQSEAQIAELMAWCVREGLAFIPYGGGSSVVGGVEPLVGARHAGVLCCDLSRLDAVTEVSVESLSARIQAGASGPQLNRQLAEHGLQLRHFPQSYEYSSLGGWIATRAGGHFATLFTHIDDFVESVRVVTPQGTMETRRLPKSGAGPDPNAWVCGSEGAFGVITEAWMRVQRKPRWRGTATLDFDTFDAGIAAVHALSQSTLYPTNCRLLQASEARLNGLSTEAAALLIVGFESADQPVEDALRRAIAMAERAGGVCPEGPRLRESGSDQSSASAAGWRQAFFDAPYHRDVLISLGVIVDTFETACTWDRFADLRAGVGAAVNEAMQALCGGGVLTCRLTHVYPDGPAPYFTFLAPGHPDTALTQWAAIKDAASRAVVEFGGTITHHHAVGRLHRPYLEAEHPPLFTSALRSVKQAWDPSGIMNPGALLPEPP